MSELLPCPFCGCQLVAVTLAPYIGGGGYGYIVECDRCWSNSGYYDSKDEAIEAWNTRHVETCRNVAKAWHDSHGYSEYYMNTSFRCSNCGAYYYDAESYYAGLAVDDDEGYGLSVPTKWCPNCGRRVVE